MIKKLVLLLLMIFLITNTFGQKIYVQRWKDHFVNDLLPYWSMPTALGEPVGNFPTYR
jgi:hypothetical protein